MSIALPTSPAPQSAAPEYLDWGGTLRPIFGGTLQKLSRLGDRFALDVTLPVLDEVTARPWIGALLQAQRQGALLPWPQTAVVGLPVAAVVNGGGQAGSGLSLRGLAPGHVLPGSVFFSIIHGGRRYLHMTTAISTASPGGVIQVPLLPMLRVRPADGAICEFVTPMIEGLLSGDSRSWALDDEMKTQPSFRIEEAK